MITAGVGAEKEHFFIHQSFLCAKSPYFVKALSGSFKEAIARFVHLPEISPVLFRIFVAWLYYDDLTYVPRLERTVAEDFRGLEITKESLESTNQYSAQVVPITEDPDSEDSDDSVRETSPGPVSSKISGHDTASTPKPVETPVASVTGKDDYTGDDATSWPYHVLIQLYVFADYFQVRELKADVLDALVQATEKSSAAHDLMSIRYIYHSTPENSPLRKYVVHRAAHRRNFNEGPSYFAVFPAEFLAAVMVTNSRRLPTKLCKECYKTALKTNSVRAPDTDERNLEKDVPPYDTDLCFYHEHPSEEEREGCRLRREDSKPAV